MMYDLEKRCEDYGQEESMGITKRLFLEVDGSVKGLKVMDLGGPYFVLEAFTPEAKVVLKRNLMRQPMNEYEGIRRDAFALEERFSRDVDNEAVRLVRITNDLLAPGPLDGVYGSKPIRVAIVPPGEQCRRQVYNLLETDWDTTPYQAELQARCADHGIAAKEVYWHTIVGPNAMVPPSAGSLLTLLYMRKRGAMISKDVSTAVQDEEHSFLWPSFGAIGLAFQSDLAQNLRENGMLEGGAFIEELALISDLSTVGSGGILTPMVPEIIDLRLVSSPGLAVARCVEGIRRASPMGEADRYLMAGPLAGVDRLRDIDILSMEPTGFRFFEAEDPPQVRASRRNTVLSRLEENMRTELLRNFYLDELLEMLDAKEYMTVNAALMAVSRLDAREIVDKLNWLRSNRR